MVGPSESNYHHQAKTDSEIKIQVYHFQASNVNLFEF